MLALIKFRIMNSMNRISEAVAHLLHPRISNNNRPKILHPEGFLVLCVMVVSLSLFLHQVLPRVPGHERILGYASTINQQTVIDQTNAERKKNGLPALVPNASLSEAAYQKARNMFDEQYWSHYSPDGESPWEFMKAAGYTYSVAGENLARDFTDTDDMVNAWMNSPTHRENIVNAKYQEIGIAVVNGKLNGVETTLVVQMFGTPNDGFIANAEIEGGKQIAIEQVPFPDAEQLAQLQQSSPDKVGIQPENNEVLALSLQQIQLHESSPLLSPLQLSKAISLAVIILVVSVLIYDFFLIENRGTVRFVGKNFAHIALFMTLFFLVIFFKGGSVL